MASSGSTNTENDKVVIPPTNENQLSMEEFIYDPKRQIQNLSQAIESKWYQLLPNFSNSEGGGEEEERGMDARVGSALIPHDSTKTLYLIGGGNLLGETSEVWTLDYSSHDSQLLWTLHQELTLDLTGRYEFASALDKNESKIWMFGGADLVETKNDVCSISLSPPSITRHTTSTKEPDDTNVPIGRTQGNNSCIVELNGEENLVIFGGGHRGEHSVPDGNLYLFNTATLSWKKLEINGSVPTPVQGHAMVSIGTKVYLFGGMENNELFDDFYYIELENKPLKWTKIRTNNGKIPHPRAAHALCTHGSNIYLCGGIGQYGPCGDLWKYNIESNEWSELEGGATTVGGQPVFPPRLDFPMTSISVRVPAEEDGENNGKIKSFLIMYGGMNILGNLFDDWWIYPLN